MCIIIAKHAGKKFNMDKVKFSQKSNEDGYGVMWYDGILQTYHTMDFDEFLEFLESKGNLEQFNAVIHLRYATVGETTISGCHPFDIGIGQMMHNGTIYSFKPPFKDKDKTKSDSSELALTLKSLLTSSSLSIFRSQGFVKIMDEILGDTINRCVIMDKSGAIHVYNEALGEVIDDCWYSNDYHTTLRNKPTTNAYSSNYSSKPWDEYIDFKDTYDYTWEDITYSEWLAGERHPTSNKDKDTVFTAKESIEKSNKVFVYGTLKEGFYNHGRLKDSEKLYDAETIKTWAMIGRKMSYPYLITEDAEGSFIQGEVYEVDASVVRSLDALEGYPHHYNKKLIEVHNENYEMEKVWAYYDETQPYQLEDLISNFTKNY